jgi:hypothetical protein
VEVARGGRRMSNVDDAGKRSQLVHYIDRQMSFPGRKLPPIRHVAHILRLRYKGILATDVREVSVGRCRAAIHDKSSI